MSKYYVVRMACYANWDIDEETGDVDVEDDEMDSEEVVGIYTTPTRCANACEKFIQKHEKAFGNACLVGPIAYVIVHLVYQPNGACKFNNPSVELSTTGKDLKKNLAKIKALK